VSIEIQNVVFACPGNSPESYQRGARPAASFYAELLGMRIAREDWFVVEDAVDVNGLNLAFGDGPIDYQPPRWPDPEFPQQMHLDISVHNLDDAERKALTLGADKLHDNDFFRVYADPNGHPFCFYRAATKTRTGRIERVVLDCFSPRALAAFYASLLDMPNRELDAPERVTISRTDGRSPALAFQHAQFRAPRWPEPAYPQQVHLDLRVPDPDAPRVVAARDLAESLGAIRLTGEGQSRHVYADPAGHPFCL
jgi:hypothetical protein